MPLPVGSILSYLPCQHNWLPTCAVQRL